jgi:hypothetical protein
VACPRVFPPYPPRISAVFPHFRPSVRTISEGRFERNERKERSWSDTAEARSNGNGTSGSGHRVGRGRLHSRSRRLCGPQRGGSVGDELVDSSELYAIFRTRMRPWKHDGRERVPRGQRPISSQLGAVRGPHLRTPALGGKTPSPPWTAGCPPRGGRAGSEPVSIRYGPLAPL